MRRKRCIVSGCRTSIPKTDAFCDKHVWDWLASEELRRAEKAADVVYKELQAQFAERGGK